MNKLLLRIKEQYESSATEELIDILCKKELTDDAKQLLLDELRRRNVPNLEEHIAEFKAFNTSVEADLELKRSRSIDTVRAFRNFQYFLAALIFTAGLTSILFIQRDVGAWLCGAAAVWVGMATLRYHIRCTFIRARKA